MKQLSRELRERFYYSVPVAGRMVGWSRPESYRAAERADIPTVWRGRFRLVPRRKWDGIVKRLLRGEHGQVRSRKSTTAVQETA